MIHQNHRKETKYYGVANERDGVGNGRMEEGAFKMDMEGFWECDKWRWGNTLPVCAEYFPISIWRPEDSGLLVIGYVKVTERISGGTGRWCCLGILHKCWRTYLFAPSCFEVQMMTKWLFSLQKWVGNPSATHYGFRYDLW